MPKGKILSLQSYVVSSYVGGKAPTLILQTRGFDVDSIYSVVFSNHTAYAKLFGSVMEESDFHELYSGLRYNHLNNYDYVVSGFMKSYSFASYLSKVVQELKQKNPNLTYFFDPVLGDNGTFYCPESFVELYRNELLPYADVITPNQFEAEKLSEITIGNKDEAIMACQKLHRMNVKTVVISSVEGLTPNSNKLTCVLSEISERDAQTEIKTIFIDFPKFDSCLIGTGDSYTALLISAFNSKGTQMLSFLDKIDAVCQSLTSMHKIIDKSIQIEAHNNPNHIEDNSIKVYDRCELALSDCIDIILDTSTKNDLFTLSDVVTSKL